MSHRIEIENGPQDALRVVFEGVIDAAAVGELTAALEALAGRRSRAVVILRAGSVIEHQHLESLRALDAEVVAESPYLARWLAETNRSARPSTAGLRPALRMSGAPESARPALGRRGARRTPRRIR